MADNIAKVAQNARFYAILHTITGILLVFFTIPLCVNNFSNNVLFSLAIWVGVWMFITGFVGIAGSGRERTASQNVCTGIFMFSAAISCLFGVLIVGWYIMIFVIFSQTGAVIEVRGTLSAAEIVLCVIIILLGFFVLRIERTASLVFFKLCGNVDSSLQDQPPASAPYVINTMTGEVPASFPVLASTDEMADEGSMPQQTSVPVAKAPGRQLEFNLPASVGAMQTTCYSPRQTQRSPVMTYV